MEFQIFTALLFAGSFCLNKIKMIFFKSKKDLGNFGENIACSYLKKKGLKLIERNFRYQRYEIDLIFLDKIKQTVIFVEVKTRKNKAFGEPEESIHFIKQQNILKAAQGFVLKNKNFVGFDLRFDSLTILFDEDNGYNINHIEHAF
jgi:putative endonuclease